MVFIRITTQQYSALKFTLCIIQIIIKYVNYRELLITTEFYYGKTQLDRSLIK